MRLRRLHGRECEAVLVNSAGGIVGGDRLEIEVRATTEAVVTLGTAAAEKCYRSVDGSAAIQTRLMLETGAALHWLPQETILFDGAQLRRSLHVDMADDATFIGAELIVFGRLTRGETMRSGLLRDSWRVRRGRHLVFADECLLAVPIDSALDRAALGGGARASALMVAVGTFRADVLDRCRALLECLQPAVVGGASQRDGVLHARLAAAAPERLRDGLAALIQILRPTLPRSWT